MRKSVMVKSRHIIVWFIVSLFFIAGCASKGPPVVKPPTVQVSQFNSTVITPQVVKFQAKILIHNRGSNALDFERVDYTVDLHDQELFTSSFDGLKRTKGRGHQTVTFPFQIAMKDILDQQIAILAEESMRVTFRGIVYPDRTSGYSPVPFESTISIPIPKIPKVDFAGTEGVPFSELFLVRLKVNNTNSFPISINAIDSFLEINQGKYQLLHTEQVTDLEPERWKTITLQMENTPGKTLSMVLNTMQSSELEFRVGGTIECRSPYGWIFIPLNIQR
jgi:LEA14-like dessication related protein